MSKAVSKSTHKKHHLSKVTKHRISRSLKSYYKAHPSAGKKLAAAGRAAQQKGGGKATAPLGTDLGMCSITAAGLVIGGYTDRQLVDAYLSLSPEDTGATIPEAIRYLGRTPERAVTFTPGTMLRLAKPNVSHAVVVDEVTEYGLWVMSWGLPYFLGWDFVDYYGEDAWRAM